MFFIFIDPMYKGIATLSSEQSLLNDDLEGLRELSKLRDELLIKYNAISQNDRERLGKMLPREIASDQLMVEVNQLAAQNGLLFKDIDIGQAASVSSGRGRNAEPIAVPDGVQSPQLDFNISGTYQGFRHFLEDLESHIRITDIEEISFSSAQDTVGIINVKVKGMSYWEK